MKTVTITKEQKQLKALVEEVYEGEEVVLAFGEKMVRLERYQPAAAAGQLNLEEDSLELERELLKALKSPRSPYSRKDLESIAERVRQEDASK